MTTHKLLEKDDLDAKWKNFDKNYVERDNITREVFDKDIYNVTSVADLGAGNQNLQTYFANKKIRYCPIDKYQRFSNTIPADFNAKEFPKMEVDCSLALGILEYMNDPGWFVYNMESNTVKYIICTFYGTEVVSDIDYRKSLDWKVHLTSDEMLKLFSKFKVKLTRECGKGKLFLLSAGGY